MSSVPETVAQPLPVIQVNHEEVHRHLDHFARDSVDVRLATMMAAEVAT